MGNSSLAWQRTWQQNYGIDLTLWNDRLDISADYYIKTSKDVLTSVTLAPSLGFSSYMDNLGEVENRGYELSLRATLVRDQARKIFWSVNGSAIHNQNKLLKISNALKAYNETQDSELDKDLNSDGEKPDVNRPRVRYVEGASMNSIWVNRSLGIDPVSAMKFCRPQRRPGFRLVFCQLCNRWLQRSGSRRNFRDEFHLERIIAECHVPLPYRRTDVQPDFGR